jgi:hypothetical protein
MKKLLLAGAIVMYVVVVLGTKANIRHGVPKPVQAEPTPVAAYNLTSDSIPKDMAGRRKDTMSIRP